MGPVEVALRRELGERVESALGQAAIALACRLDETVEPSPAAAVARELRMLLDALNRSAPPETGSEIDDLRARRAAREAASG